MAITLSLPIGLITGDAVPVPGQRLVIHDRVVDDGVDSPRQFDVCSCGDSWPLEAVVDGPERSSVGSSFAPAPLPELFDDLLLSSESGTCLSKSTVLVVEGQEDAASPQENVCGDGADVLFSAVFSQELDAFMASAAAVDVGSTVKAAIAPPSSKLSGASVGGCLEPCTLGEVSTPQVVSASDPSPAGVGRDQWMADRHYAGQPVLGGYSSADVKWGDLLCWDGGTGVDVIIQQGAGPVLPDGLGARTLSQGDMFRIAAPVAPGEQGHSPAPGVVHHSLWLAGQQSAGFTVDMDRIGKVDMRLKMEDQVVSLDILGGQSRVDMLMVHRGAFRAIVETSFADTPRQVDVVVSARSDNSPGTPDDARRGRQQRSALDHGYCEHPLDNQTDTLFKAGTLPASMGGHGCFVDAYV